MDAAKKVTAQLQSLHKARAKGPQGRRLPTAKQKVDTEQSLNDSNENVLLLKEVTSSQHHAVELEEEERAGTMPSAEFDRIWFLRMRTLPRLSLGDDRCCHLELGGGDCERLILPPLASTKPESLLGFLRTPATTTAGTLKSPEQTRRSVHASASTRSSVHPSLPSEPLKDETPMTVDDSLSAAADSSPLPPMSQRKNRWRTKSGTLCIIL